MTDITNRMKITQLLGTTEGMIQVKKNQLNMLIQQKETFTELLKLKDSQLNDFVENVKSWSK